MKCLAQGSPQMRRLVSGCYYFFCPIFLGAPYRLGSQRRAEAAVPSGCDHSLEPPRKSRTQTGLGPAVRALRRKQNDRPHLFKQGFTQNKGPTAWGVSLAVTGDGLTRSLCLSGSGQRSNSIHKSATNSPVEILALTPQSSLER